MEQLSLFEEVSFDDAMNFHQMLEECRSDYACRYIKKFDKPAGLSWEIWYSQVIESTKFNGPLSRSRRKHHVVR